ncbi:unnamed protein product [Mycena citricolor]|uniref:Uncharacterized protein n=1 Tax=Mycena citricolor TaxID=2018698 RepID=A0AAD2K6X9_9AGAR|nr:unnamed protein product [Mycena citricolor]
MMMPIMPPACVRGLLLPTLLVLSLSASVSGNPVTLYDVTFSGIPAVTEVSDAAFTILSLSVGGVVTDASAVQGTTYVEVDGPPTPTSVTVDGTVFGLGTKTRACFILSSYRTERPATRRAALRVASLTEPAGTFIEGPTGIVEPDNLGPGFSAENSCSWATAASGAPVVCQGVVWETGVESTVTVLTGALVPAVTLSDSSASTASTTSAVGAAPTNTAKTGAAARLHVGGRGMGASWGMALLGLLAASGMFIA